VDQISGQSGKKKNWPQICQVGQKAVKKLSKIGFGEKKMLKSERA
jgi:hypothetical protein